VSLGFSDQRVREEEGKYIECGGPVPCGFLAGKAWWIVPDSVTARLAHSFTCVVFS
jgi:hypothetical protein